MYCLTSDETEMQTDRERETEDERPDRQTEKQKEVICRFKAGVVLTGP